MKLYQIHKSFKRCQQCNEFQNFNQNFTLFQLQTISQQKLTYNIINQNNQLTLQFSNGQQVIIFDKQVQSDIIDRIISLIKSNQFNIKSAIYFMPDIHISQQTLVGLVGEFQNKLSPNILGNDIGCGVLVINLHKSKLLNNKEQLNTLFQKLDSQVRLQIGLEKGKNESDINDNVLQQALQTLQTYPEYNDINIQEFQKSLAKISQCYKKYLGTLGTGNHFIELDYSKNTQQYYILIHSGSRQLGKMIFEKYQKLCTNKDYTEQDFEELKIQLYNNQRVQIPSSELISFKNYIIQQLKRNNQQNQIQKILLLIDTINCESFSTEYYLKGKVLKEYLYDIKILTQFAKLNRLCMYYILQDILSQYFESQPQFIDSPHNFINGTTVHKGSQFCQKDKEIFIPLNARDGTLIVTNDIYQFAPHGTGRKIPVSQAIKEIKQQQMKNELQNIYITGNRKTSEAPSAYKNIDQFTEELQHMNFKVKDHLISLFNVKSDGH